MPKDAIPALAKLTRPRMHGIMARERLFSLLDERRARPVVWIIGPPGTGKTTLVASYLNERKLPGIWYQVDDGDRDPATLVYYLRQAARRIAVRKRKSLPLLTPEYLADLPGFVRRFFRELYSRLPSRSVFVLDNYQEVGSESTLHAIIQEAIVEIPAGITLIVISRTEPPPESSRHLANNLIARLDWDDLRLTLEETTAIAAAKQQLDEETLGLLQLQSDGWVAGLILMLERVQRTGMVNCLVQSETMDTVFNYFAGQVFDQASPDMRDFLLRTAFLQRFTVKMAEESSANPMAHELLDGLYRGHWFTERRPGGEISYQYHALFREFLLARARDCFSAPELQDLKRLAAKLLEQNGQMESAVELIAEEELWQELTRVICQQAPTLLTQGRHDTLQRWISAIPQDSLQRSSWLLYWRGQCRMISAPPLARADLEQAYTLFKKQDDPAGLFLTCGALIHTYTLEMVVFTPVVKWAEELKQLMNRFSGFPSLEIEAQVLAGLQALVFAEPSHPLLAKFEERAYSLMHSSADPQQRLWFAYFLLGPMGMRGEFGRAGQIVAEINPILDDSLISPLYLVQWRIWEGNYNWWIASYEAALQKLDEALAIGKKSGVHLMDYQAWALMAYAALSAGDTGMAQKWLGKAETLIDSRRTLHLAQHYFLKSGAALLRGNVTMALEDARTGLTLHEEAGTPFLIAVNRIGLAQIMVETGDMEGARSQLENVLQFARTMKSLLLEHQALLVEAYSWLRQGEENAALMPLREGLRIGRENDFLILDPWWRPLVIARLLALALESGIEKEYVRRVIKMRNLRPESPDVESWPWPVRIYTLGRFSVVIDDETLRPTGKAKHKPLELLKCLIALGGRGVSGNLLTDVLWPDAEGDTAQNSFDITLHRLRKLLRSDAALTLHDGKLSLEALTCWVDAWAFERLHGRAEAVLRTGKEKASELDCLGRRLLRLYQGGFLGHDAGHSWMRVPSERMRRKFLALLTGIGLAWENACQWDKATQLYERGLEGEPLAEELYRRLMLCHQKQGQLSAAVEAYRRCRDTLSTVLGVAPAAETETLYQTLRRG